MYGLKTEITNLYSISYSGIQILYKTPPMFPLKHLYHKEERSVNKGSMFEMPVFMFELNWLQEKRIDRVHLYPDEFQIFKYDYSMSRDKKVMIDDHDYEVSGNRLRKLRESLGLTLEEVASVAGTSRAMVHDWETGDKKIPSEKQF